MSYEEISAELDQKFTEFKILAELDLKLALS